jgi:hypothetical protein
VGGCVLVTLLAAGTGLLLWAAHYQPLEPGGFSDEWPVQRLVEPGNTQSRYSYDVAQYGSKFLVYPHKAGYQYGFLYDLRNQGPYPVQVLGVGGPDGVTLLSDPRNASTTGSAVELGTGIGTFSTPSTSPFKAFELAPQRDSQPVGMTWTYHGCPAATTTEVGGGANFLTTFTVKYKFLWFTHTTSFLMTDPMGIVDMQFCTKPSS